MSLRIVHQVLIVGAIALGAVFALRSGWLYAHGAGSRELWVALAGLVFAGVLGLYLRRFRGRLRASSEGGGRR